MNKLNSDILNTVIDKVNILSMTDFISNCFVSIKVNQAKIFLNKDFMVVITFNYLNVIILTEYKILLSNGNTKNKYSSSLPIKTFNDLFNNIELVYKQIYYKENFIINDNKIQPNYFEELYLKINGINIKNVSNKTKIFLFGNEICTLNHGNNTISINNVLHTDDFSKILYHIISSNIYNFNLELNSIRNNIHKDVLNELSYDNLNTLILEIQKFFNNFNK